ncbi:XRE family transcriptional regulator [Mesorhizobium sp. BAC0120]|uniref:helix-turn-helix domain-containing protein n=1 Tax=Mesorhizobium sp. BAC0120 TaxID=3090670 RepID=UPI00298C1A6B|nr:XRE family transcriptional regulator [Mesorhizobium sp. BAC0120]MDW6020461.1 XRE family transcriptional regulator [Mesorhizobium sp. BAC0120]
MENIRPIKTEADYEWAIEEITAYFEDQPEPGTPEGDRFDVLATLIEAYEDAHYPISDPDPVETIAAHMQMKGLTRRDLAEVLGSSPRASEVLRRRRAITLDMAYKLNRKWGIPAELLIQPYRLAAR